MTNVRITTPAALEWEFCPYCGQKTELDQEVDSLLFHADGEVDVVGSELAGFDFQTSVRHCGYHIRLWVPDDGTEAIQ